MTEPLDPISDLTAAAVQQHELYASWILAGFSEDQAFELLKLTLAEIGWGRGNA